MWSGRQAIVFIGISVFIMSICGCRGVTSVSEVIPASRSAAPPAIHAQANPDAIVAGQSSNLSWSATGADAVSIDGFGSQPMSGSTSVAPAQTTTYTLRAKGAGGETDTTVTVTVRHPDPPPAPIPTPSGEVNVLTWHLDNARTGLNNQETILTPANLHSGKFGKLFSYLVDGYLYAQPLCVSNLSINGARHNVVFAATEYDSVYAFDTDNFRDGTPLWKTSLLQPGETPQRGGNPKPWIGVTSTPVIDLSTETMYVVSAQDAGNGAFFRLHALDITTGSERKNSPVLITASVPGSNKDSVNGIVTLTASCLQRTALLLNRGILYFGFSACGSGWVLGYDAATLGQTGVLNTSPNANGYGAYGGAGGVWMGGGGPVGDENGFAYVTTGNGPYDGSTAWGDSILKLDAQLHIVDHFTPFDYNFLQCKDLDLSGGGAMLIPQSGRLLAGGKGGKMYLVNKESLGGVQANDAGAAQTLWFNDDHYAAQCTNIVTAEAYSTEITGYQIFSTAAYFNGSLYLGVTAGPVKQFAYSSGQLHPGAETNAQIADGTYGTTPFISANGTQNGIVWMLDHNRPIQDPLSSTPAPAVLRAYDASNIALKLYDSSGNPNDQPGYGIKFTSPIVANGKVFIGTAHDTLSVANPQGELDVYGLRQ